MSNPRLPAKNLVELFRTPKGVVYQDDCNNGFLLEFMGKEVLFKVQEFLHFRKSIDRINLEDLLMNDLDPDLQIIHHKNTGQLFLITLCDLVALKELLSGAKVMLELNSIICSRLSPFVL
ncbi:MAG: hypothetical protein DHS20C17_30230 [Cyclobacteriaceae bacterium]|nr:MAG: hypothetical protein DHS20C17_30230 [Cyclobacteriaceae bacterium]